MHTLCADVNARGLECCSCWFSRVLATFTQSTTSLCNFTWFDTLWLTCWAFWTITLCNNFLVSRREQTCCSSAFYYSITVMSYLQCCILLQMCVKADCTARCLIWYTCDNETECTWISRLRAVANPFVRTVELKVNTELLLFSFDR